MAVIKKAFAEDFERIYPLIQEFDNPNLNREDWRQLFIRRWSSQEDHFGYFIEDDKKAVGFLGTIFSTRMINQKPRQFCNLSTWVVKKEYRGMSLLLLFEALKLENYTITNFTANRVVKILKRFGFKDLASHFRVVLPTPNPRSLLYKIEVISDKSAIRKNLTGEPLEIFNDHMDLKCFHLLLRVKGESCYLVFDKIKKKRLPGARLHYISNPEIFQKYAHNICLKMCLQHKLFALVISENMLKGNEIKFSIRVEQLQSMLFKSNSLEETDMDTLYSEFQVLGLRT
ncbi:MAG: hypothetical protein MUO76_14740 [Anaerolineaceae bacterium]|nr:hypothetical protein [Anaerolineaceae bacterium]